MTSVQILRDAYAPLVDFAQQVDEEQGWVASLLPGWTVRDLVFHLAADCQRALVALATPSPGPADTDEVSYWSEWKPGSHIGQANLRGTRIMASAWSSIDGPVSLYVETAHAVLHAAERADPAAVVVTQGRRLTVDSLVRTLAVEAAVHHLDLEPASPGMPTASVLREVRRVLDGLLGMQAPQEWDDVHYVRIGTGRLRPSQDERAALGQFADRLPLFG